MRWFAVCRKGEWGEPSPVEVELVCSSPWKLDYEISVHSGPVHGIDINSTLGIVASASWDRTCNLFDVKRKVTGMLAFLKILENVVMRIGSSRFKETVACLRDLGCICVIYCCCLLNEENHCNPTIIVGMFVMFMVLHLF